MDLGYVETQLKKRLAYPYRWPGKQTNQLDQPTNFIYTVDSFDNLLARIDKQFGGSTNYGMMFDYALIRWYNFWLAMAVEQLFRESERVVPAVNQHDRLVDFSNDGITFDHKTSRFPWEYPHPLHYAVAHPESLIEWLYANQSQQRRKHLRNRLLVVLHSSDRQHWKLKVGISWRGTVIDEYLQAFCADRLHRFQFDASCSALSDIIRGVR